MKKLISVLLVLMLLGSLCGMSAAYFPDTVTHWARTEILAMADAGVIRGYTDGTFRPDNSITRAEFVTLIVRRYNPAGSGSYSWPMDVAMTSWYYDSFRQAYTAGLIPAEMLSDSRFHADRAITREQAAAILNLALNLPAATGPVYYADLSSIAVYAQDAVANVTAAGIFGGYEDGTFRPSASLSRAEVAAVIYRVTASKPVEPEKITTILSISEGNYTVGAATNVTVVTSDPVSGVRVIDSMGNTLGSASGAQNTVWTVGIIPTAAGAQTFIVYATLPDGINNISRAYPVNVAPSQPFSPVTASPQVLSAVPSSASPCVGQSVTITVRTNATALRVCLADERGRIVAQDSGIYTVDRDTHIFLISFTPSSSGEQTYTVRAGDNTGYYIASTPITITLNPTVNTSAPAIVKVATSADVIWLGNTVSISVTANTKTTRVVITDIYGQIIAETSNYTSENNTRIFTFSLKGLSAGIAEGYAYAGDTSGYNSSGAPFTVRIVTLP